MLSSQNQERLKLNVIGIPRATLAPKKLVRRNCERNNRKVGQVFTNSSADISASEIREVQV